MIPVQTLKAAVLFLLGLAIAIWAVPRESIATGYPKKPLTLVVAYSPGGAVDNVARTVAKYIQPYLGQRVVVQNKPGAGGEIGYRSLAVARNDGYTLGMITSPPILMLDKLRPGTGIEMQRFEAIVGLQKDPVVLAVNRSSPFETLDDLLAASRERRINVAGDGPNSNNQLQLVVAEDLLGVDFNFVPYSGSGPSITSLLGDQVDAAVPSASSATTYALRGDLRILAVFSPARYEYLPDAPTIAEASGIDVPDVGAAVRGVVLPAGVPAERRAVLEEAFANLSVDEDFVTHARTTRLPLYYQDADQLARYLGTTGTLLDEYIQQLGEAEE
ncbi:MAG: tripartite tricarboxylate transporter substrate binding protein [Woeseiaceae bacterium]|nr:tripartite tricarboxylate transporter substrate binding protein [Woeseiaceae bacterium]